MARSSIARPDEAETVPVETVAAGAVLCMEALPVDDAYAMLVVPHSAIVAEVELVDLEVMSFADRKDAEGIEVPAEHHLVRLNILGPWKPVGSALEPGLRPDAFEEQTLLPTTCRYTTHEGSLDIGFGRRTFRQPHRRSRLTRRVSRMRRNPGGALPVPPIQQPPRLTPGHQHREKHQIRHLHGRFYRTQPPPGQQPQLTPRKRGQSPFRRGLCRFGGGGWRLGLIGALVRRRGFGAGGGGRQSFWRDRG